MRPGSVLLNFARDGIVDDHAVVAALAAHKLKNYVCDFPSNALKGSPCVIALPHLGASTREAEDNSAVMVVDQLRDYLEHGNVRNAVNFPEVVMSREAPYRVAIANANVPNMLGQISTTMAHARLNIHNMLNKSRGEMAYTLVDVDSAVPRAGHRTDRGDQRRAGGAVFAVGGVRFLELARLASTLRGVGSTGAELLPVATSLQHYRTAQAGRHPPRMTEGLRRSAAAGGAAQHAELRAMGVIQRTLLLQRALVQLRS